MPATSSKPETDLCARCCLWLRANGWDVHEEVAIQLPGSREVVYPDIIALREDVIRVVEAKITLGPELILQGERWRDYAHEVYLLCHEPTPLAYATHRDLVIVAMGQGLGLLVAPKCTGFITMEPATHNPRAQTRILIEALAGHRNTLPAGTAAGHRWRKIDRQWDWVRPLVEVSVVGVSEKEVRRVRDLTREEGRKLMKAAEAGHVCGVRVETIAGVRTLVKEEADAKEC